jgi:hypothetical protein
MIKKPSERRREPRAPFLMSVQFESSNLSGGAQTVDISSKGLFLGTRNPLPVGTLLNVHLGDARVRVRVARVVEADDALGVTPGMGCSILEADPEARRALRAHLARTDRPRVRVVPVVERWPDPHAQSDRPARARKRSPKGGARGKRPKRSRDQEPGPAPEL